MKLYARSCHYRLFRCFDKSFFQLNRKALNLVSIFFLLFFLYRALCLFFRVDGMSVYVGDTPQDTRDIYKRVRTNIGIGNGEGQDSWMLEALEWLVSIIDLCVAFFANQVLSQALFWPWTKKNSRHTMILTSGIQLFCKKKKEKKIFFFSIKRFDWIEIISSDLIEEWFFCFLEFNWLCIISIIFFVLNATIKYKLCPWYDQSSYFLENSN